MLYIFYYALKTNQGISIKIYVRDLTKVWVKGVRFIKIDKRKKERKKRLEHVSFTMEIVDFKSN